MTSPSHSFRYPDWLASLSFGWMIVAWTLAAAAPRFALMPAVGFAHEVLPAVTVIIIVANLCYSIRAVWDGVPVKRLLFITALQFGLFTALFFQIAAHLGAEHYRLPGPTWSGQWVVFSVSHAVRAADLVDTVEAYEITDSSIRHRGVFVGTVLVIYRVIIDLFALGLITAAFRSACRQALIDRKRGELIRGILLIAFVLWVVIWLASAILFRPWRAIDFPLWAVENVVRVLDVADAMESYDIHWHQVPKGWWEATMTFLCRLWIALGIGLAYERWIGANHDPDPIDQESWDQMRIGVVGVALGLVLCIGLAQFATPDLKALSAQLATAATGEDARRMAKARRALRRMGPNAGAAVAPLTEAHARTDEPHRGAITETLGHLGPEAIDALRAIADSPDEADAVRATSGLARIGAPATLSLIELAESSTHPAVRTQAKEGLRDLGPDAVDVLAMELTRQNSAGLYPWFEQLDRNWTLRSSSNPTFRALVRYHARVLPADSTLTVADAVDVAAEAGAVAVPELIHGMTHKSDYVRRPAIRALGEIGPPAGEAASALVTTLSDPDAGIRALAFESLVKIGPGAVPALTDALTRDEVVPARTDSLDRDQREIRVAVLRALAKIGPAASEALPTLIELARRGDKYVSRAYLREVIAAIREQPPAS